jgi:hypothetical protein
MITPLVPRTQRSAISAFTRVFDALWLFAERCAAEPGPYQAPVFATVTALRSGMKNAAPRPGHETSSPQIAARIVRVAVAPFLHQSFEFA